MSGQLRLVTRSSSNRDVWSFLFTLDFRRLICVPSSFILTVKGPYLLFQVIAEIHSKNFNGDANIVLESLLSVKYRFYRQIFPISLFFQIPPLPSKYESKMNLKSPLNTIRLINCPHCVWSGFEKSTSFSAFIWKCCLVEMQILASKLAVQDMTLIIKLWR